MARGKRRNSLDTIMRNAKKPSKLAEDLLDLTKIENNKLKLRKEIFNIAIII